LKRLFTLALVALSCTVATAGAVAKMGPPVTTNTAASWSGTWKCTSGKNHYNTTFTPIFNGNAMRVTIGGPNASEGLAMFDKQQGQWFYTFVGPNGNYLTLMGPAAAGTVSFTRSFPSKATLVVHRNSNAKYTSVYTAMQKGKKMISTEVCTKS